MSYIVKVYSLLRSARDVIFMNSNLYFKKVALSKKLYVQLYPWVCLNVR